MREKLEFKKKKCFPWCMPLENKPLVVSGYAYTEYEINFCQRCGRVLGKLVFDRDNLYSK